MAGFLLTIFLIVYIWWPLAEEVLSYIDWSGPWWLYMDWLLVGIFLFMSLTVISRADLKSDSLIVFVGDLWRPGDRILGNTNKSVALLHRRATALMDHPRLANCKSVH